MSEHNGKCIVICAPSGSGKTSIVHHLLQQQDLNLAFSVSATNRSKRAGEENGIDYWFLDTKEFQKKIDNQEFVEWEEVYEDTYYGTLKSEITRLWSEGKNVIFDVDVKGGLNLSKIYGEQVLAIFIKPPSLEILAERLKKRGTESAEKIAKRIEKAKEELSYDKWFDYIVVNDKLEDAFRQAKMIVEQFLKF